MGVSLAMVFHVASAVVVLILAGWGLRLQRDLRFLRSMIAIARSDAPAPERRIADVPGRFVLRLARVFDVPVSGFKAHAGSVVNLPASAIVPAPIVQMFLRGHVSLIQFSDSRTIEIQVEGRVPAAESHAESLTRSFGGAVRFTVIEKAQEKAQEKVREAGGKHAP